MIAPTVRRTITVSAKRPAEPTPVEERVTNKIMACLPIFGTRRAHLAEASIHEKIQSVQDMGTMIRLIELKNQYKAIAIVRMALVTAFLFNVGGEEWGTPFLVALSIGFLPSVWIHGRNIFYNLRTIKAVNARDLGSVRPIL